jgi:hypothetical protein
MSLPAGVEPPAPDALDDVGIVHALDGDATALCTAGKALEQVDHQFWSDVPIGQRCQACAAVLGAING